MNEILPYQEIFDNIVFFSFILNLLKKEKILNSFEIKRIENEIIIKIDYNNFDEVSNFVNAVIKTAKNLNHHPTINFGYNYVYLSTTTHDKNNNITKNDIDLIYNLFRNYVLNDNIIKYL
jgi:pterin-4a-carbinolamine dehydratase